MSVRNTGSRCPMVGCAIASSTRDETSLGPGPSKTRWGTRMEFMPVNVIQRHESMQTGRMVNGWLDFGWIGVELNSVDLLKRSADMVRAASRDFGSRSTP